MTVDLNSLAFCLRGAKACASGLCLVLQTGALEPSGLGTEKVPARSFACEWRYFAEPRRSQPMLRPMWFFLQGYLMPFDSVLTQLVLDARKVICFARWEGNVMLMFSLNKGRYFKHVCVYIYIFFFLQNFSSYRIVMGM